MRNKIGKIKIGVANNNTVANINYEAGICEGFIDGIGEDSLDVIEGALVEILFIAFNNILTYFKEEGLDNCLCEIDFGLNSSDINLKELTVDKWFDLKWNVQSELSASVEEEFDKIMHRKYRQDVNEILNYFLLSYYRVKETGNINSALLNDF